MRSDPPGKSVFKPRDRRTVTVLFADVVGSTAVIEKMDAERALAVLDPALDAVSTSVERYGGTVVRQMGDGVLAMFGAPVMQEDHALRACAAALEAQAQLGEISARVARQGIDLKMRIGLNSGPVVVISAEDHGHTAYDVMGPTVHLANRIEAEAEPGTIAVSEATFQLVWRAFACRAAGARTMKGFTGPRPVYQLLEPKSVQQAQRGLADHEAASLLVGRAAEAERVRTALAAVAAGTGGMLLVVGEAGVGKSRLLAEARKSAPPGIRWLDSGALSFGAGISYWPFIELLRPMFFGRGSKSEERSWAEFAESAAALLGDEAPALAPYIATLLGLELPGADADRLRHLDGEALGANVFRAARRLFERLADRHPLVVLIEDVHWADRSSLLLLAHLLPLAGAHPILFCCSSRPDADALQALREPAARGLGARFQEIALAPLSVAESQALLVSLLDDHPESRHIRDQILYKAEGNPFFIEEVIRTLVDLRVLVQEDGSWAAHTQEIVVPDTIQAVLLERFDRLDARLKDVLAVAAVIGRTFLYRVLSAVSAGGAELERQVAQLATIQFIEEMRSAPELAYIFRHALTHDAIYENLLIERRRQVHGRVAACLEDLFAGQTSEITSVLAYHYARSERFEKALPYLLAAAEQSSRMAADHEALQFYEQAIETYAQAFGGTWESVERAILDGRLGEIHFRRGDHAQAAEHLCRAIAQFGDRLPTGGAALALATAREIARYIAMCIRPKRLKPQLNDEADDALQAHHRPYVVLGWVYYLSNPTLMPLLILRGVNVALASGHAEYVAKSLGALGYLLDVLGLRRMADPYHRRAVAIAERFPRATTLAFALNLLGVHQLYCGRWAEAEATWLRSLKDADASGDLLQWSSARTMVCELWCETGAFERARVQSDELIKTGLEAAYQPALRWGLMMRGKVLRRIGRPEDAIPELEEAVRLATGAADFVALGSAAGELGLSLQALGRDDAAATVLQHAVDMLGARRPRFHSSALFEAALAEFELHRVEQAGVSPAALRQARRRCLSAMRWARRFRIARPAALRLKAHLAFLTGRRRAASRHWRRAIVTAERLGAHTEATLARRQQACCLGDAAN